MELNEVEYSDNKVPHISVQSIVELSAPTNLVESHEGGVIRSLH